MHWRAIPTSATRHFGRAAAAALALALLISGPLSAQDPSADTPVIDSGDTSVGRLVQEGPGEPEISAQAQMSAPEGIPAAGLAEGADLDLPDAGAPRTPGEAQAMQFAVPAVPEAGAGALLPGPRRRTPVVVELFTSQGCSSCPPADALLAALAGRPDVLPLSFHVDYWDYLGWADIFARPDFTARQRAYALRSGERAIWTPQIMVGGADTLLDLTPVALQQLIDRHRARAAPLSLGLARDGTRVTVDLVPMPGEGGATAIELVRYLPQRTVAIRAGENRGRSMDYRNIVIGLQRLATWDGRKPLRLTIRLGEGEAADLPADTAHAILIQALHKQGPGPILAALPLD